MAPEEGSAERRKHDAIATKMVLAKERLGAEVKNLGDLIEREILNAGDWPPAPEISLDIRRRSMALGARAVKLLDAVDKLESMRAMLEEEISGLSSQVHELRMKSSGISPAELAHLKMEKEVLKDHVKQLESAISDEGSETAGLQAENAKLAAQLKELEGEVNRLLGASTEAIEAREEGERLQKMLEALEKEVEDLRVKAKGGEPGPGVLAAIWAEQGEEGSVEDRRILDLQERIAALEGENEQLMEKGRKRLESVKRQRDDLAEKVVELAESSIMRAEQAIEEIVVLQKERDGLREKLNEAEAVPGGNTKDRNIRDETTRDLEKVIKSLEGYIGELEEELDKKDEELGKLQSGPS